MRHLKNFVTKFGTSRRDRSHKSSFRTGFKSSLRVETLESRQLLAADLLFTDSFEVSEWNGHWVEDSQNDWFRSTQRATDGSQSAEIDGSASNATLTLANPLDLSGYSTAELTFSWYIESSWDTGEYIAVDVYNGSWQEVDRLQGNVDVENTWHHETISLDNYLTAGTQIRFRASVSDSTEDGNVDNVKIVGTLAGPPQISISDATATEGSNGGKFIDVFAQDVANLQWPSDLAFGPDGDLYVLGKATDNIVRFDGVTGATKGEFVLAGSGGLDNPNFFSFGPDGNLYVASRSGGPEGRINRILRFDGFTGEQLPAPGNSGADFVVAGAGGLDGARSPVFGPDGNLYVSSVITDQVLRFDGQTGLSLGVFLNDHLDGPGAIQFRDGMVYISNSAIHTVARFDAITGAFIDNFVAAGAGGLAGPNDMHFGSDGHLYVMSWENLSILRYDGITGQFIDVFATQGEGGLGPNVPFITFGNDGLLYIANEYSGNVLRFGQASQVAFTVSLNTPATVPITVAYSSVNGSAIAGSDFTAVSGTITFAPGQTSRTILVSTLDDSDYEGNESFAVNLSTPVGGVIAVSQGVATILDNDLPPTKFYVVNDGSPDQTYEYGASGAGIENYSLGSGNTSPRGAASNLAGDTVWVVDANKEVYVYGDSGGALGSWTAGSLASNATVEGVATNGTDVWIVDARQDRVYRYANAASRLSGSQNATSSFALNSGNRSPKDLVTDGTHLWVVNDSTTDKVFKYTLSGSLVGSWTINSGGGSPTGITLDPSGASQSLWTVDSASDRVYEYTNSRSKSSGSQAAAASFALAAGNTNPQGIADPPAPISAPVSAPAQSQPSGQGSNAQLPSSMSFGPIVASGQPVSEPNRSSSELDRSMVRSLREELPTVVHATSHQSSLSNLVMQPARSKSTATESERTSGDDADSALADTDFESFDDALLGLLAQHR